MVGTVLLVSLLLALLAAAMRVLRATGHQDTWPAVLIILAAPLEVYRTAVGPFNLSVFRLAVVLGVGAMVVAIARRHRTLRVPVALALYAILIVLQIASVALVSTAPSLGLRYALQYAGGVAAVSVILCFLGREHLRLAAWCYVASAALPAVASAWRALVPPDADGSHTLPGLGLMPVDATIAAAREEGSYLLEGTLRMHGTFGDPNHFGFFIATVLVVAVGLALDRLHELRPLLDDRTRSIDTRSVVLIIGVLTVLAAASYSRSTWLLVALGTIALAGFGGLAVVRPLVRRSMLVPGAVAIVALGVVVLPTAIDRLNPATKSTAMSNDEHLRTMRIAVDLFVDRPVTGTGLGAYGSHAGQPDLVSSAHSTLLTTAAELGAPGAMLLLAIVVLTSFWGAKAVRREERVPVRALMAALIAAWLAMAVSNSIYEVWADDFQWALFGIVLVACPQPIVAIPRPQWPFSVPRSVRA